MFLKFRHHSNLKFWVMFISVDSDSNLRLDPSVLDVLSSLYEPG